MKLFKRNWKFEFDFSLIFFNSFLFSGGVVDTTSSKQNSEEFTITESKPESDQVELDKKVFAFINQKVKGSDVEFQWSVDDAFHSNVDSVIIKYTTKVKSKNDKLPWEYTEVVSADSRKLKVKGLADAESFVWKIGFSKEGNLSKNLKNKEVMVWSDKGKFKTERAWGIMKILILIGSLGMFIYGMKQLWKKVLMKLKRVTEFK